MMIYKLWASVTTGLLCCSQNGFHITQTFPRAQEQRVKHFGEVQHVQRFHTSLNLVSKGTAHNTFTFVTPPVYHGRRRFEAIRHSFVSSDDQTTTLGRSISSHTPARVTEVKKKIRSSREIRDVPLGTCACCRHKSNESTLKKRCTHTELRTRLVSQPTL